MGCGNTVQVEDKTLPAWQGTILFLASCDPEHVLCQPGWVSKDKMLLGDVRPSALKLP